MKKFIDRVKDMETLNQQFQMDEAALVVVYGRRRIGKTALITEFLRNKQGIYFLATEESEEQNRNAFRQQVAEFTGDELLAQVTVDNWDILFERLTSSADAQERMVIAIDEFQYLGKANPAFPSVFQRIWDTVLSKRNVIVVLCGSLISLMYGQTLSSDSPLYGRRTAQIHMRQIPFNCYHEFFPKRMGQRELVELYGVTGGVPKYIESFLGTGATDDVFKAIEQSVLNPNSYLFEEPNFLLSKEVNEVGSYFSILRAIAAGNSKSGDISKVLGVKQTGLTRYLKALEDLDILERVVPVTETNPSKSKKGLYRIKDNFLRFWFRFVFPKKGLLETGQTKKVLGDIKKNFVSAQAAYVYEEVRRQWLWEVQAPIPLDKVGAWWGAQDIEFDVVGLNKELGRAVFGECKFWNKPVGTSELVHLEAQVARALKEPAFKDYRNEPVYVFFSIGGYSDAMKKAAAEREDLFLFG